MAVVASLCITCYNQESYIIAALESAFAQSYSPLEIIVCDDCSTDQTSLICESLIANYKGPHKVVFHRNNENLGVARNYDCCFRMANGDLRITGSGDDISAPNRVSRLVAYWLSCQCKPMAIIHNANKINVQGKIIGKIGRRSYDYPLGAATAYSAKLFDYQFSFPPGVYEDHIYAPVAEMLGGVVFLDEVLMDYRIGTGLSTLGFRQSRIRTAQAAVVGERQTFNDLQNLKARLQENDFQVWERRIRSWIQVADAELRLYTGSTFRKRWTGFKELRTKNIFCTLMVQQIIFLLPRWMGDFAFRLYFAVRSVLKCRMSH